MHVHISINRYYLAICARHTCKLNSKKKNIKYSGKRRRQTLVTILAISNWGVPFCTGSKIISHWQSQSPSKAGTTAQPVTMHGSFLSQQLCCRPEALLRCRPEHVRRFLKNAPLHRGYLDPQLYELMSLSYRDNASWIIGYYRLILIVY